jgi:hypothetical protein
MQTAVLASVFGFPGVGQLMQKRWAVGVAFASVFAVALSAFLFEVWTIMDAFYGFAFHFDTAPAPNIRLTRLFVTFSVAIAVFIANVIDAVTAQARLDRQRRQARLTPPPL